MQKCTLFEKLREEYGIDPEYPFEGDDTTAVFRRRENGKWFVLSMCVPASRLGLQGDAPIEILNLKCEPILTGSLTDGCHIFPAYHMNKTHWISVRIDNGLQEDKLFFLIDMSYRLTASKSRKKKAESV